MHDLISRRAAIDALWKEPTYSDALNVLTEARDRITALPSVRPEVLAHGEGELSAQPERWIPCYERLPEKDWYYLITTCYRQVYIGYWNEDHFDRTEAVIAWMPLPEPYKGEQE